ncbi:MAG: DUF4157 domain-containing protein [Gammaproteobacteria bacterium]|nr:DUF4157 domain-containing protein [Gammaproteobacteria bacterium]
MSPETTHLTSQPVPVQAVKSTALQSLLETKPLYEGSGLTDGIKQLSAFTPPLIQPKLKIGASNDKYEQEADRVADQVMRMPISTGVDSQSSPQIQRMCSECEEELQRQTDEEEEEELQTKSRSGMTPQLTPVLSNQINGLRGKGQSLEPSTRTFMESRFGRDFSQVRIHADGQAANIASSINARAFTVGQDVVFAAGQYQPGSHEGRRLMAHELTHVVQQSKPGNATNGFGSVSTMTTPHIQRAVTFQRSCDADPYLKCAIYEAVRDARRVVDLVISALDPIVAGSVTSGRIVNLLNVHFHVPTSDQIREIHRRFGRLKTALISPPAFQCFPSGAPECSSAGSGIVGGRSTVCRGGAIDICRVFNNFVCKTRSHVIIHELAHHELCAAGDIYAGLHPSRYMTLSNVQAMQNADSYAQFAEMVDMGAPICRDCYLPSGARPVDGN